MFAIPLDHKKIMSKRIDYLIREGYICENVLLKKEMKNMFLYGFNICAGGVVALCIFPQTFIHIFCGYRGTEVIGNLAHGRDGGVIKAYFELINNSLFAGKFKGCLILVVLLSLAGIITKYFVNIEWEFNKETKSVTLRFIRKQNRGYGEIQFILKDELKVGVLLFLSYSLFALVAVRGSEIVHNRYLYPIYPIVALVVILIMSKLLGIFMKSVSVRIVLLSVIVFCLCIGSLLKYGVDFLYTDYDVILQQAQEIKGTDCLLYYGDSWLDVYTAFPLRLLHDETYFMRSGEMDSIKEIMSKRDTENTLVVCLPLVYSEEDTRNILDKIISQTGSKEYRMIYKYEYLQEWIID